MKSGFIAALIVGLAIAAAPTDSDAKRLGGGRPAGMQRSAPDKAAQTPAATPNANPQAAPNTPAAAPTTAAAPNAAAAAPKRSWMGPIAGLAAGLGLAALFSHFGLGEGLANFMMMALLAVVAVVAIGWLVRRFASAGGARSTPFAMAGAGRANTGMAPMARSIEPRERDFGSPALSAPALSTPATTGPVLPANFDAVAFERIAKMIFIRLQAANDTSDLNDLRAFTTPELFASLKLDLQERGSAAQQTDVTTLNAELLDFAQEPDRQVVSVRFHGLIREEAHAGAQPFDEVWHLVQPLDGSRSWAIAGIQPTQPLAVAA